MPFPALPPVAFRAAAMEPVRLARSARRQGLSALVDGDRILVRGAEEAIHRWGAATHCRIGVEPLPPTVPGIAPDTARPAALAAILAEGMAKWRKRGEGGTVDARMIHKIRVQMRRMRAAISLLGDREDPADQGLKEQARAFASAMGPAREIDVCLAETLPEAELAMNRPGALRGLAEALAEARALQYQQVRALLTGPEAFSLQLAIVQRAAVLVETPGPSLGEIAPDLIAGRVAKLKHRGRKLADMDAAPRHRLRIGIKKLRYLIEFMEPVLAEGTAVRFTQDLADLQDRLGHLNDAAVVEDLLVRLGLTERFDAGLLIGWLEGRPTGLRKLERRWRRILAIEPFWSLPPG